jgi:hypothetical protein
MRIGALFLLALLLGGCTRAHYRRQADRESYGEIAERDRNPAWVIPEYTIQPDPHSRLADNTDPDHPPMPPDDPAADCYMKSVYYMHGSRHWHDHGDLPWIEDPGWKQYLALDSDGKLELTPTRAVELGLENSREYQTAKELLYENALALTLNRFEFDCHWSLTNLSTYDHFGADGTESSLFTSDSAFGFTRNFAAGGQLMADLANALVFQFAGGQGFTTTSNITVGFIQPLLRGAGRKFRLEPLTEAERNLLYAVRDFAHFRKQFTVSVTAGAQGYLQLLLQVQNVRNIQNNFEQQAYSRRLHQALFQENKRTQVEVDQALQAYLTARASLLQAQAGLETSLDQYKILLGLPPSLPVQLDEGVLKMFELNSPAVKDVNAGLEALAAEFRQFDKAPPLVQLREGFKNVRTLNTTTIKLVSEVEKEVQHWKEQLDSHKNEDALAQKSEEDAQETLAKNLKSLAADLRTHDKDIADGADALTEASRAMSWEALQNRIQESIALVTDLLFFQTQARVYLIRLRPVEWKLDDAVRYALDNRLDLMNERGRVVDAWRQVDVTANLLRAGLTVSVNANIATPPFGNNPVDFRASASDYNASVNFDGPLNRMVERNAYRLAQIGYQQTRRNFMALDDQITRQIRNDLRQLDLEKVNFDIARQALISASRQVVQAGLALRSAMPKDTATIDYLQALQSQLQQQQNLISNWVSYETTRLQLLLDLEALQLDERGLITDERNPPTASDAFLSEPGTVAPVEARP